MFSSFLRRSVTVTTANWWSFFFSCFLTKQKYISSFFFFFFSRTVGSLTTHTIILFLSVQVYFGVCVCDLFLFSQVCYGYNGELVELLLAFFWFFL